MPINRPQNAPPAYTASHKTKKAPPPIGDRTANHTHKMSLRRAFTEVTTRSKSF